jgi:hypothetical protein
MPVGIDAKIVQDFANKLKKDLSASVINSGISASGDLAKSFREEIDPNKLRIFAAGYVGTAEVGRRKTVNGGNGGLREQIRRWIDQKGIIPKPNDDGKVISKDSLAFLISRKIHKQGTLLNQDGGTDHYGRTKPTGIITGVINDGRLDSLKKQLITSFVFQIKQDIKNGISS